MKSNEFPKNWKKKFQKKNWKTKILKKWNSPNVIDMRHVSFWVPGHGKRPLGGFTWTIAWLWFGVDFAHLSAGFRWKLSPGGGTPFEEKVAPSATHQVAAHFAISSQIKCQPVSTRLNLFFKFFKSLKFSKIAVSWSMNFLVDLNIQKKI